MIDLVRQEVVQGAHTLVIKIGTNVLTAEDGGLDRARLGHLAEQIAEIHETGKRVVIVSSGAIGAGLSRAKLTVRPSTLPELQAVAAIGQADLIQAYDACLRPHGFAAAQILLTANDFNDRARYLNARNCILQLLRWNAVPVINENDTISVAEIRFGDNDQLAAMVTNLLQAPLLIILSVVDGLYAGAYQASDSPEVIDKLMEVDEAALGLAGASTSGLGTGGMRSKLLAARMATAAGESVWIANGKSPDVLRRMMKGEKLGTLIPARGESVAAWKRWIGFTAKPRGVYTVDAGAESAVRAKGKSLLPIGVVSVRGDFEQGDVVELETHEGRPFARGLTNYSAVESRRILGQPSARLAELLPGARYEELIHRDHLVLL